MYIILKIKIKQKQQRLNRRQKYKGVLLCTKIAITVKVPIFSFLLHELSAECCLTSQITVASASHSAQNRLLLTHKQCCPIPDSNPLGKWSIKLLS